MYCSAVGPVRRASCVSRSDILHRQSLECTAQLFSSIPPTTFMYPVYHPIIPSSSRLSDVRPQALRAFLSNAVSQERLTPERRTPPPSVMKLSATRSGWRRRKHADHCDLSVLENAKAVAKFAIPRASFDRYPPIHRSRLFVFDL